MRVRLCVGPRPPLRYRRGRRGECANVIERLAGADQPRIRLDSRRRIGMGVRRQLDSQGRILDLAQNAVCNHGYSCGYDTPATLTRLAVNSNSTVKLNENIVRVGVNFKFGH